MLQGDKVRLFVAVFLCAASALHPNRGSEGNRLQRGSALSCRLAPLKVQVHMEQETSLLQTLLHAGQTAKSHGYLVCPIQALKTCPCICKNANLQT